MNHDVGHFEFAKIEQATEHVTVGTSDAALPMEKIYRALEFFVPGQNRLPPARIDADHFQESAHQHFNADEDRAENGDEKRYHASDEKRSAVWVIDRHGFRHH